MLIVLLVSHLAGAEEFYYSTATEFLMQQIIKLRVRFNKVHRSEECCVHRRKQTAKLDAELPAQLTRNSSRDRQISSCSSLFGNLFSFLIILTLNYTTLIVCVEL